jgi:hypothetical protein
MLQQEFNFLLQPIRVGLRPFFSPMGQPAGIGFAAERRYTAVLFFACSKSASLLPLSNPIAALSIVPASSIKGVGPSAVIKGSVDTVSCAIGFLILPGIVCHSQNSRIHFRSAPSVLGPPLLQLQWPDLISKMINIPGNRMHVSCIPAAKLNIRYF